MNKSMKPSAAAQRPLTEEEKEIQLKRAFMQKKASLAEGILYNLIQNPSLDAFCRGASPVVVADEMSTEFMKIVYGKE